MPPGVLGVQASGKLTAEDYTRVLGPAIAAATADGGKLRVVLMFEGAFDGMDAGAVWQDFRTGVTAWHSWERIALVTDQQWMVDGLRLFAWAVPGEARAFAPAERAAAISWAAGSLAHRRVPCPRRRSVVSGFRSSAASSSVTRPLGGGPAVGTPRVLALGHPRPSRRAVLPALLPAEHGQVHQAVAPERDLGPAVGGPVGLEDPTVVVADVAGVEAEVATATTSAESRAEYQGVT